MFQLIISALCLFWAANLKDPDLLQLRAYESPVLILVTLAGIALVLFIRPSRRPVRVVTLLCWISCLTTTAHIEYSFYRQSQTVLTADDELAHQLTVIGQHLVVGYESPDQIKALVQRGYVGGIYLSRRNALGKTVEELRAEITALQSLRREAELPPLIVATDQEGGSVAHLSPPLPRLDSLATIDDSHRSDEKLQELAFSYGSEQAKTLGSIGVNVNLSPVVDLKPNAPASKLDFHTQIARRAISADPQKVTVIAQGYSKGLIDGGITPTLKHFPGLGSVREDSHHFRARLQLSEEELQSHDWTPFRTIASTLPVFLMVGHIVVDKIDPDHAASMSEKIVTGILRKQWQFNGIVISDDMTMAAAYDTGLCSASINSLNAGVDILLVSYDWEKVYPVLTCLQQAYARGRLKNIGATNLRLKSFFDNTRLDKSRNPAMDK